MLDLSAPNDNNEEFKNLNLLIVTFCCGWKTDELDEVVCASAGILQSFPCRFPVFVSFESCSWLWINDVCVFLLACCSLRFSHLRLRWHVQTVRSQAGTKLRQTFCEAAGSVCFVFISHRLSEKTTSCFCVSSLFGR